MFDLLISVPRLDSRVTLRECKDFALSAVAHYGITRPPDTVEPYDGMEPAWGGPFSNPQGYDFTWHLTEEERRQPVQLKPRLEFEG
jgi:hypothetical protein